MIAYLEVNASSMCIPPVYVCVLTQCSVAQKCKHNVIFNSSQQEYEGKFLTLQKVYISRNYCIQFLDGCGQRIAVITFRLHIDILMSTLNRIT